MFNDMDIHHKPVDGEKVMSVLASGAVCDQGLVPSLFLLPPSHIDDGKYKRDSVAVPGGHTAC